MSKNPSNTQVKVGWILDSALPLKEFPLAATLNGSLDLTSAIAWANYAVGASNSADLDDRALDDLGNAVSRGAASYSATLSMFRDQFNTEAASVYVDAFQAFRTERTLGWLVVRINKLASLPWAAGDEISLYKLLATTVTDKTDGVETTKFTVKFLPQGNLYVHTQVGAAGVISGVTATRSASIAAGPFVLNPICGGASIRARATYVTSDPAKATVSVAGVVTPTGVATDAPTITVSYGAATASVVQTVTLAA